MQFFPNIIIFCSSKNSTIWFNLKKYKFGSHQNHPKLQHEESHEKMGYTRSVLELVFQESALV